MEYLGNRELLKQQKTAFLASGTIAPDVVLRCYDWATGEHEGCVVSGFSSLYGLQEEFRKMHTESGTIV